jgi:hypothetical protein
MKAGRFLVNADNRRGMQWKASWYDPRLNHSSRLQNARAAFNGENIALEAEQMGSYHS